MINTKNVFVFVCFAFASITFCGKIYKVPQNIRDLRLNKVHELLKKDFADLGPACIHKENQLRTMRTMRTTSQHIQLPRVQQPLAELKNNFDRFAPICTQVDEKLRTMRTYTPLDSNNQKNFSMCLPIYKQTKK